MGRWRDRFWDDWPAETVSLDLDCEMCSCHHKIHWSVVSILVNVVSLVLFTTAVATPHWASQSFNTYDVNTGLFQSCTELNDTCYDTHVYFDEYSQKNTIMASAVLSVFALIGMWIFFALSVFFLCGLFEEKQLATGAVVTSYASDIALCNHCCGVHLLHTQLVNSADPDETAHVGAVSSGSSLFTGLLAIVGTIMYAAAIKSLNYSLSWSFILAVLGFCVSIAAGVLMCVGRNISTRKKKKKKRSPGARDLGPIEELQMEETDTTRKKVWATGGGQETTLKKSVFPGASIR